MHLFRANALPKCPIRPAILPASRWGFTRLNCWSHKRPNIYLEINFILHLRFSCISIDAFITIKKKMVKPEQMTIRKQKEWPAKNNIYKE